MIIPMLCVTIFVILVVWFLLPRVARLMIHTPTAISIFVCLSMVQLMAVFISMRCTLCGHFLQVALTIILVFFSSRRRHTILQGDWSSDVCSSDLLPGGVGRRIGRTTSQPQFQTPRSFDIRSSLTMVRGAHSLKFGGEVLHVSTGIRDVSEIGRASCRERV